MVASFSVGALYTLACAMALAFFFREFLSSGLDRVFGALGDARLNLYILEHWLRVFSGTASWRSPHVFHPAAGVLGYSDALFLHALPYAALRAGGAERYLAFEITLATVKATGFAGMAIFLRGAMRLPHPAAALGALLFTVSSASYAKVGHPQLLAVGFVPWLWWLLVVAVREREDRARRAFAHGTAAAVLGALLLYTSFYIGWFAIFCALLYAALYVVLLHGRKAARAVAGFLRAERAALLAMLVVFAVALLPFLVTYLPVRAEFGSRRASEVLYYMPGILDVINAGPGNLLWGWLSEGLEAFRGDRPWWEIRTGHPLLLTALFVSALVSCWRSPARGSQARERLRPVRDERFPLDALAMGLAVLAVWILSVRIGDASAWRAVHALVPGAGAIRAVGRIQLVLGIAVIAVAMAGLVRLGAGRPGPGLARRGDTRPVRLALCALGALLLAENYDGEDRSRVSRSEEASYFASVGTAPSGCGAFYVDPPFPPERPDFAIQIDAMLLSQREELPTLNGYSGHFPRDWNLLDVRSPDYPTHLRRWVERHGIGEGLCAVSLTAGTWSFSAAGVR